MVVPSQADPLYKKLGCSDAAIRAFGLDPEGPVGTPYFRSSGDATLRAERFEVDGLWVATACGIALPWPLHFSLRALGRERLPVALIPLITGQ